MNASPNWILKEKGINFDQPKCFVYFIRDDNNLIKIGKAGNPYKRIKDFERGSTNTYELLYLIPCKDGKTAFNIEHKLHDNFAEKRLNGEWFDINQIISHDEYEDVFSMDEYSESSIEESRAVGKEQIIISYAGYTGPLFLDPRDAEIAIGIPKSQLLTGCRDGIIPYIKSSNGVSARIYINMMRFMKEVVCGERGITGGL